MIYVGIDAGKQGAVAWIEPDGPWVVDIPTIKDGKLTEYDLPGCWALLKDIRYDGDPVNNEPRPMGICLERMQARPPMGRTTAFAMGGGYQQWRAWAAALGVGVDRPTPAAWKKFMGVNGEKESSVVRALELFPSIAKDIARHDRAEALLLAEYLRRTTG